jgi:hypothetical protein
MRNLSNTGRIFYGIAIAGLGLQTMYYGDFPYMLIPPEHSRIPGILILSYIAGILLVSVGASIVFEKRIRTSSLLLGSFLLLIFCVYFIPYQLIADPNYIHFGAWENAEKELALSAGAFVMAASFSEKETNNLSGFFGKLMYFGPILFSATIICFSIGHFLYAKEVAEYIPSWVPNPIFWAYLAGIALFGSGISIILKIRIRLFCTLLGTMIFIWFIILHIPKVIAASGDDRRDELASALLALAYSGIAFVIAHSHRPFHQESVESK